MLRPIGGKRGAIDARRCARTVGREHDACSRGPRLPHDDSSPESVARPEKDSVTRRKRRRVQLRDGFPRRSHGRTIVTVVSNIRKVIFRLRQQSKWQKQQD